jgi:hypothetical protein
MRRPETMERCEGRQDLLIRCGNQQAIRAPGIDLATVTRAFDIDSDTGLGEGAARREAIEAAHEIGGLGCSGPTVRPDQ